MGSATITPAIQMQEWVCDMVRSRKHEGSERATHSTARDLGLTQSRVVEILKGRVGRVWADEFLEAQARYARFCERQADALEQQAATVRAKRAAIQERLDAGVSVRSGETAVVDGRAHRGLR